MKILITICTMFNFISSQPDKFNQSETASAARYLALYKYLGRVQETMIDNTHARKERIAMHQEQTFSRRTKYVCNFCKLQVRKSKASKKRCVIYLNMNVHKCNPVMKSEFLSSV